MGIPALSDHTKFSPRLCDVTQQNSTAPPWPGAALTLTQLLLRDAGPTSRAELPNLKNHQSFAFLHPQSLREEQRGLGIACFPLQKVGNYPTTPDH